MAARTPILSTDDKIKVFLYEFINMCLHSGTAKRLPQAQPASNPPGMVLTNRPTERTANASCCS